MAPSRGLRKFIRVLSNPKSTFTRSCPQFPQIVSDQSRSSQIYISRSSDPYVNLSIEHYLLQKSPADSTVLFLYTNKPCIVIGRNQNPWVEVNLGLLNSPARLAGKAEEQEVNLVRRRSGGGTVFHDAGNVNYSVICPTPVFNRDKHAHMVVEALRRLGVAKAKVNERHDIVLDINANEVDTLGSAVHQSLETSHKGNFKPLKVSGSAYKLTRLRSLHHGTCLLNSPNIADISKYLRSPAKPFIKARGVNSVSSQITNVNVPNEDFERAVVSEFRKMYGSEEAVLLDGEEIEVPEIAKGLEELKSLDWIYLQTPQFTFSSSMTDEGNGAPLPLPNHIPADTSLSFTARNGVITEFDYHCHSPQEGGTENLAPIGEKLHEIEDWKTILGRTQNRNIDATSKWLNALFGLGSK